MTDSELIPLAEAARRMRVSDKTIRRWIKSGRVAAYRRGESPHGPLFIDPADLDAQLTPVTAPESRRPEPRRPADNRPPKDKPKPPDSPQPAPRKEGAAA